MSLIRDVAPVGKTRGPSPDFRHAGFAIAYVVLGSISPDDRAAAAADLAERAKKAMDDDETSAALDDVIGLALQDIEEMERPDENDEQENA
jgi:hypothetical protein